MSTSLSVISSNLKKKTIPFYTPNSITTKPPNHPSLVLSSAFSKGKILNSPLHDKPNLISLVSRLLLVNDQSNYPPEIPGKSPPEFPRRSNSPPSIPPEVPELPNAPEIETGPPEVETQPPNIPEVPTPGPDYSVPRLPTPPTPPDIPLPPPGTPRPSPPDQLPPRLPLDPDILPPLTHPPPDIPPPQIKPPPEPYVSFVF
ncbi:hypothetical protein P3X46_027601 [Hevea brasiliensis]|uniref:Uncharacterized protein n=1 Tax=Hevea brasiliensis TaxID=3981 RepID=A0ABQ9L0A0_HEVBR|nr:hypothetical protein P3X46_027601 [Hevea brasiliensis]